MVWGPPRDRAGAINVLREAVRLGVNHIDTSDYYGPHIANEIIREALHPYPKELVIVTKVRRSTGSRQIMASGVVKKEIVSAVHDNLRHLGLDVLDVVNLRVDDSVLDRWIARGAAHCSDHLQAQVSSSTLG